MIFTYKPVTVTRFTYDTVPLLTPVRIVDCPRLDGWNQPELEKYLDRRWEVFARNPMGLNVRTLMEPDGRHEGNIIIWREFVLDKRIFQL